MSEERLSKSSNKLDIEGAQRLSGGEEKFKETYKKISEDIGLSHGEFNHFLPSLLIPYQCFEWFSQA